MEVLELFKKISKIPHCSRKTEKLRDFIADFCKKESFEVSVDGAGNIVARKGKPKICLQAHYDMVCVGKAPDIEVIEENGLMRAKESSLGADNGMGVAMMLDLCKKRDNLELLFTNDEEIGMLGVAALELKIVSKRILNLDTEEEGKVYIGCAGGVEVKAKKSFPKNPLKDMDIYKIYTKELPGGHSGVDIDKDIPNAIKEIGYYLAEFYPSIVSIQGGEALNSIPKSAEAIVAIKKGESLPKNDMIYAKKIDNCKDSEYFVDSKEIVDTICGFAHGVRGYDKELCIPSVSVNLAKIQTIDDTISFQLYPRANEDALIDRIQNEVSSYFENLGYALDYFHWHGAWKPEINDFSKEVLSLCKEIFEDASFSAIHAGLECGMLLEKLGDDKMIASIGLNIFYPHSTNEYCEIESVKKVYKVVEKLTR